MFLELATLELQPASMADHRDFAVLQALLEPFLSGHVHGLIDPDTSGDVVAPTEAAGLFLLRHGILLVRPHLVRARRRRCWFADDLGFQVWASGHGIVTSLVNSPVDGVLR